jgi:hypothetical protein
MDIYKEADPNSGRGGLLTMTGESLRVSLESLGGLSQRKTGNSAKNGGIAP